MSGNNVLSLLGLCLRGGNLAMGEEPVEAVARAKDARVLLLAADAADNTRRRTERFADMGNCLWLRLPFTKAELGGVLGRSAVALVAVTDIGLASAVVHRLAELDPVKYDEAAERLDVKAKRAAARKAEQLAHEKNLRQGKRRPKTDAPAEQPPAPAPAPKAPPPRGGGRPYGGGKRPPSGGGYKGHGGGYQGHSGGGRRPAGDGPYRPKPDGDRRPPREDGKRPPRDGEQRPFRAGGGQRPTGPGEKRPHAGGPHRSGNRPYSSDRPKPKGQARPFAHSHPVKKGKGSFRKKEG